MPVSASSLAGVHVPRDQRRLIENTGYSALPIQQAHSVQQEYGYGATNPDYLASYGGGGVYTSPGSATNDLYYVGAYQQYANDNRVNAWHGGGTSTLRRRGRRKVFTFTRICGLIATVHFVLYVFCGPYWLLPGMPPSEFERPEDFIVATNAAEISKLTANLSREADNTEDAQSVCHQLSIRETLTIVTAASDWYFGKLIQNLKSIAQFESRARVVVYDIGLTSDHLFTLQQWLQVRHSVKIAGTDSAVNRKGSLNSPVEPRCRALERGAALSSFALMNLLVSNIMAYVSLVFDVR